MSRKKSGKETEVVSIKCDKEIASRLAEYCAEVGQTKTHAVERMLGICLNQWEKHDRALGRQLSEQSFNNTDN